MTIFHDLTFVSSSSHQRLQYDRSHVGVVEEDLVDSEQDLELQPLLVQSDQVVSQAGTLDYSGRKKGAHQNPEG